MLNKSFATVIGKYGIGISVNRLMLNKSFATVIDKYPQKSITVRKLL